MHFFGRLPITQRWFSRVVIFRWVSCVLESNLSLSPLFGRLVSYRYLSSEPPPRPTLWPPVGMAIGRPHWDESAETWIVFCWTQVSLSSKPHLADFGSNLPDAAIRRISRETRRRLLLGVGKVFVRGGEPGEYERVDQRLWPLVQGPQQGREGGRWYGPEGHHQIKLGKVPCSWWAGRNGG